VVLLIKQGEETGDGRLTSGGEREKFVGVEEGSGTNDGERWER
jgi:hypothetical protein